MNGQENRGVNVVLTADGSGYARAMSQAQTQTNAVTESVNKLLESVDRLTKASGRKLEIISAGTTAGILAATAAAGKFESQLSTLQAQAAITGRDVSRVGEPIDKLRRELPVTTEQIVALATALQKMGAQPSNLENLARIFVKLSAATGEDVGSLATGMVDLQRQMGTSAESTDSFANSLAHLSANMGVSATGVLQFSRAIAPIARTIGMTQNEIMGISAAFQKSGQEGFMAASAFTKMQQDISRAARYGSPELAMYANLIGRTTTEFRQMSATQQTLEIFEALSRQGPDAIKTLDRMGFDGARAQRAIQGVVASGDLRRSLGLAQEGFGSDALDRGAQAAMDGLNDSLQKLRNNLTSIAQEFGSTFLPVITGITDGFTRLTSVLRDALGPVNSIMGILTGASAAGTGLLGFGLSNFGLLSAAAGGLMLARSGLTAGFAARRQATASHYTARGMNARAIRSFEAGEGTRFQRGLYRAGQFMYMASPTHARDIARERLGPRDGRSLGSRVMAIPGALWATGMNAMGSFVDPLRMSRVEDMTRRSGDAFRDARASWRNVAAADGSIGASMRTAAIATGRFAAAVSSATLGVTRLALAAGGGMLRRAGGALLGLAGGPAGLAIMGGFAAAGLYSDTQAQRAEQLDRIYDTTGPGAAVNKYAAALGLASQATMSFAETVRKAEGQIPVADVGVARTVTASDTAAARRPGRSLTDTTLESLNPTQAGAYASSVLASGDPQLIQAMKLDLIQQFGPVEAQKILNAESSNIGDIIAQEGLDFWNKPGTLIGRSSKEVRDAAVAAVHTADINRARIFQQYGDAEAAQYSAVAVNQLLDTFSRNEGMPAAQRETLDAIGALLGMERGKLRLTGFEHADLLDARTPQERTDILLGSKAFQRSQASENWMSNNFRDIYAREYVPPAAARNARDPLRGLLAGRAMLDSQQIQFALANEADPNAQLRAATGLGDFLIGQVGTQGGVSELQRLKALIGDPEDPRFLMAQSAQDAVRRIQGAERSQMSTGDQMRLLRGDLVRAYQFRGPDAEQQVIGAEDAYMQARSQMHGRLVSAATTFREFDVSQGRAREDFGISMARSREDFDRQMRHQAEDYYLSVRRSEEDYQLQRMRGQEDFHLSRVRSEDDFRLQRKRGEEDYNLQRLYAYQDFTLSRQRIEEDFAHSNVMRARQMAKQMTDVFQMIVTQPTWDAGNLLVNSQDQLNRMRQQQSDLAQLRQMGLSGDVIELLGLNQFSNHQQTARLLSDFMTDPSLIQEFNKNVKGRLDLGQLFATDEDSDAWKEIRRQFDLQASRSAEDFERMMQRGAESFQRGMTRMSEDYSKMVSRANEDFGKGMSRMSEDYNKMTSRGAEDYGRAVARQNEAYQISIRRTTDDFNRSMRRMQEDLNRSFEEITGTFEELSGQVLGRLTGTAHDQMSIVVSALADTRTTIKTNARGAYTDVDAELKKLYAPGGSASSNPRSTARPREMNQIGGPAEADAMADGYSALLEPMPSKAQAHPIIGGKYRFSSNFGMRIHPVTGRRSMHTGQDLAAPTGTGVAAAMSGVVTHAGLAGTYGNLIKITHGNGFQTYYAHLSRMNVRPGQAVTAGERIGAVGSTGRSTGPHLHFELRQNGKPMDPRGFLGGAATIDTGGGGLAQKIAQNKYMLAIEQGLVDSPVGSTSYRRGQVTMNTVAAVNRFLAELGDTAMDVSGWHRRGAIFSKPSRIGVGEGGPEAVLPLNERGADFLANTMRRFAIPKGAESFHLQGRQKVEAQNVTYHQKIDAGQHLHGEVTVVANDPMEMFRKLEEQRRLKALVRRTS